MPMNSDDVPDYCSYDISTIDKTVVVTAHTVSQLQ